jgi:hypothetical protein
MTDRLDVPFGRWPVCEHFAADLTFEDLLDHGTTNGRLGSGLVLFLASETSVIVLFRHNQNRNVGAPTSENRI